MSGTTGARGDAGPAFAKAATGIEGFDEITGGGLPRGRTSLVCGSAGSGKTLFGLAFLVHGAERYGEPGVLMTFEQTEDEIARDVASLGYDLPRLVAGQKIAVDHVHVERSEVEETGEYDLEALFVRLQYAISSVGARRVVLDTIETLFGGLTNEAVLRAELRRLFRWLKDRGMTTVVTGERGDGGLTRQGLEEYVSDAVILLDHRVVDQVSTRRLRVVKYRGSHHGTNEYPFLIDQDGINVLPVTSMSLDHLVSDERLPAGIDQLDDMLGGEGFYRGSTVLVSGTAGAGKTSLAGHFIEAAARRGERCLWFVFEESPAQIARNLRSIGIDLAPHVRGGLLRFIADRPTRFGLETHLATMHREIGTFRPSVVVVDPVTNLLTVGSPSEVRAMLTRLIDYLKTGGVTAMLTSLTSGRVELHETDAGISSLIDTWIVLTLTERDREWRRDISVIKSRGMAHSNRIRACTFTQSGLRIGSADLREPHREEAL